MTHTLTGVKAFYIYIKPEPCTQTDWPSQTVQNRLVLLITASESPHGTRYLLHTKSRVLFSPFHWELRLQTSSFIFLINVEVERMSGSHNLRHLAPPFFSVSSFNRSTWFWMTAGLLAWWSGGERNMLWGFTSPEWTRDRQQRAEDSR